MLSLLKRQFWGDTTQQKQCPPISATVAWGMGELCLAPGCFEAPPEAADFANNPLIPLGRWSLEGYHSSSRWTRIWIRATPESYPYVLLQYPTFWDVLVPWHLTYWTVVACVFIQTLSEKATFNWNMELNETPSWRECVPFLSQLNFRDSQKDRTAVSRMFFLMMSP